MLDGVLSVTHSTTLSTGGYLRVLPVIEAASATAAVAAAAAAETIYSPSIFN